MNIKLKLLDLFFPERCPFCLEVIGAEDLACEKCMEQIRERQQPIARGALGYRCVSSFLYDGKVRRMLIRVKFYDRTQHIRQVAAFLHRDIAACYAGVNFDLITYVPMHEKDRKHRGYNQSELLAREIGKLMDLPVTQTLVKTKHTKKQHELSYAARKTNLRGAFALIDREAVKGKHILIIDDIVTSGYTLGTCAKELNKAQPDLICCATVADAEAVTDRSTVI